MPFCSPSLVPPCPAGMRSASLASSKMPAVTSIFRIAPLYAASIKQSTKHFRNGQANAQQVLVYYPYVPLSI